MNHGQQSPQPSLPTTPLPSSIPINLAGFLTEESIHVEGDAGNVHFSGHFNIHNNWLFSPGTETKDNPSPFCQKSSFSSLFSSLSPNTVHVHEENDKAANTNSSMHSEGTPEMTDFHDFQTPESSLNPINSDQNLENEKRYTTSEMTIRTRLRSGAISPVSYVSRRSIGETSGKKLKCRRRIGGSGNGDVLKRMLRRSSFPVRPCSSYAVFVMDKWSANKAFSFEEKSKQLGHMWAILPQDEKKVYVDLAFKDKSRYKKQCSLLRKGNGFID
ncbi:hypothetical protein FRX31_027166 [Thalictrum thalictroides]|uniref:HMG box domain-containing protein n=1 Tax=Thalictrum thalictroides TaxID=46969 RepID=A0A7J6VDS2_THATH|nr:hypothetical protein FRX31_027166 [Thalictrum thalictroides]